LLDASLQLGALSAHLVRLWVNPALKVPSEVKKSKIMLSTDVVGLQQTCDFLLMVNSNQGCITLRLQDVLYTPCNLCRHYFVFLKSLLYVFVFLYNDTIILFFTSLIINNRNGISVCLSI